ncbi:MAG: NAD-dependent malic enzyme, partial [Methanothrix harundinacea]
INLEDISAPRCFEIEDRLKRELDIPVFHDDQHGTAVVTGAAMINALKIVGKRFEDVAVVFSGAGAAGVAVSKFLMSFGVRDILLCDSKGIIHSGRGDLNPSKMEMARITNPKGKTGSLADALEGADVFIGVSAPGIVSEEMVRSMAKDPIVFAMANPIPEIMPELAKEAGARVVATGRSDYPNQVNNVLGFPGIFRGALDVRARDINEEMKMAAGGCKAQSRSRRGRKESRGEDRAIGPGGGGGEVGGQAGGRGRRPMSTISYPGRWGIRSSTSTSALLGR